MHPYRGVVYLVLAVGAALSFGYWWQAAQPVIVVDALSDHLGCVSYAPFRDRNQTPYDKTLRIEANRIDADLGALASRAECVRIYSVSQGLAETARLAEKHRLKVMLGIWIGSNTADNEREIARGIATARRYAASLKAIVVGNEVLLRGEQSPAALRHYIERVKAQVPEVPVTYADVWEFWLRHAELADVVDFATIHILPYWEDRPVPVEQAAGHVSHIYRIVKERLPGEAVMVGETGWPSYGRQRQGARPSLVNQARFIREFQVRAQLEGIPYNLIEAYDQHWKRVQEGAAGGHWGLFDNQGQAKFPFKGPVMEAPAWSGAALGTAVVFLAILLASPGGFRGPVGLGLTSVAAAGANVAYWRDMWLTNRDFAEWVVTGFFAVLLLVATNRLGRSIALCCRERRLPPRVASVVDLLRWVRRDDQSFDTDGRVLGALRFAFLFGAALMGLWLVFDPRYRDFPLSLYAVPSVGFALLAWLDGRRSSAGLEEILLAGWLAVSGTWTVVAEHVIQSPGQPWSWAADVNPQAIAWWLLCLSFAASVLVPVVFELRAGENQHAQQESDPGIIPSVKD